MKRFCLVCGLLGLLLSVRDGAAGPLTPLSNEEFYPPPVGSTNLSAEFRGGQLVTVQVRGSGEAYMGLYVYDGQGNCIVWDDHGSYLTADKLAVNWTPRETATYSIEIYNSGFVKNKTHLVVR